MSVKYAVIYERGQSNWAAYVPDLPGCMTTGSTLDETKPNIREAIQGHLETLRNYRTARVSKRPSAARKVQSERNPRAAAELLRRRLAAVLAANADFEIGPRLASHYGDPEDVAVIGTEGKWRVLLGGCWDNTPEVVRVSCWSRSVPAGRNNVVGFRCAGEDLPF